MHNPYRNFVTQNVIDPEDDPFHPDSSRNGVHSSSYKPIANIHDGIDTEQHSFDDGSRSGSNENREHRRNAEDLSELDGFSEYGRDNSDEDDDFENDCSSDDCDSDDVSRSPSLDHIPSMKRKTHSLADLAY